MDGRISRITSITGESYKYMGLGTVVERARSETGVNLTYAGQSGEGTGEAGDFVHGIDRFGRVIDQRWRRTSTGGHTERFKYGYDRNGNRLYEENVVQTDKSELYHDGTGYDKFDRLTSFSRGTLDAEKDGISGTPSRTQSWSLDALGNWSSVTTDGTPQTRTHNKQNQLTGDGTRTYSYDGNGNLQEINVISGTPYDAWNRLMGYEHKGGIQRYEYDALGRRIASPAEASAGVGFAGPEGIESEETPMIDHYYTQWWQVIEDRNGDTSALMSQYVWSPHYVDELVLRDRDADGNGATGDLGKTGSGLEERVYVQQDANYNVTALTDTSGTVMERFVYDPYGAATVLDANWAVDANGISDVDFVYFHQGGR